MQNPAFQPTPTPPPPGSFGAKLTGAARGLAFTRAISGKAFLLAGGVFLLQAVMPEGSKPSNLIGSFHGSTESAEMDAKRVALVQTTRDNTNAQAVAPVMAQSYAVQSEFAGIGDAVCIGGNVLEVLFGRDAKDFSGPMKQACGQGDKIRANITRSITQTARAPDGRPYLAGQ